LNLLILIFIYDFIKVIKKVQGARFMELDKCNT